MHDQDASASVTRSIDFKIAHTWRIEKFQQLLSMPSIPTVESGIFSHEKDPGIKWHMELATNSEDDNNEGMSLFLYMNKRSTSPKEVVAKYSLSVLRNEPPSASVAVVEDEQIFRRNKGWGQTNFMKQQDSQEPLMLTCSSSDGSLVVKCTIKYTKHESSADLDSLAPSPAKRIKVMNTECALTMAWHDVRISVKVGLKIIIIMFHYYYSIVLFLSFFCQGYPYVCSS